VFDVILIIHYTFDSKERKDCNMDFKGIFRKGGAFGDGRPPKKRAEALGRG
jgi:hypothetical protein